MNRKTFGLAQFKELDGDPPGTFEALVSVFGNVDVVNDRVMPGAFAKSLERWKTSGDPIPVVWSHKWDDPQAHVGKVLDAAERPDGLWVKAQLDLDQPFAAQTYRLLKERRVREFSFAYDVIDERRAKDGVNELLELDLIEVGPTLKGANPATQLLGVKAAADGTKAVVSLAGSLEQHRAEVARAAQDWALRTFGGELFSVYPEATFEDRVVVYVEMWEDPWGEGRYYEASYSRSDGGEIELGDPQEVGIEGRIVPKARRSHAAKDVQRVARAAADIAVARAAADTASSDGGDEAKSKANPEAGDGKGEEPETRSPLSVLAEVELEALSGDVVLS